MSKQEVNKDETNDLVQDVILISLLDFSTSKTFYNWK